MSRTSYLRRPLTALLVAVALAVSVVMAVVVLASPAWAATYTVNSTADTDDGVCTSVSGGCTLREAINAANTTSGVADTINFNLGSAATIPLTSAQLPPITDVAGLTIDGGSADITISGDNKYRVFAVGSGIGSGARLTLSNLTVANGAVGISEGGGGIRNIGSTLEVSNSTISSNSAYAGGGIYIEGDGATLEVSNSTISDNSADLAGGGIDIFQSRLTSGIVKATVSNSTISGNSTNASGGGIYNQLGTLEVSNSTISGNSADPGFGGGGIQGSYGGSTLKNTIVANSPSASGGSCAGTIADGGYNLDSDGSCGFGTTNHSLSGTTDNPLDPKLGPLADNGGPTKTHALLAGSPAIDKGDSFGATTDQRGVARPQGAASDIGSFESESTTTQDTIKPHVSTATPTGTGVARGTNLTATFSEKMDPLSISNSTFKLFKVKSDGSTTQITNVTVSKSTDGLVAKLNPFGTSSTVLGAKTKYKGVITTGAKDVAGNQLDQNPTTAGLQQKGWTFTTKG
jgi:CSLREA domain-containing protein